MGIWIPSAAFLYTQSDRRNVFIDQIRYNSPIAGPLLKQRLHLAILNWGETGVYVRDTGWSTGECHEEYYGSERGSIRWSHGNVSPTNSCRPRCLNQANLAIQFVSWKKIIWFAIHPNTVMDLVIARIDGDSWNVMICIFPRGAHGNWACSEQNGTPKGVGILPISSIFKRCVSRIEAMHRSVAVQKVMSSWEPEIAERRYQFWITLYRFILNSQPPNHPSPRLIARSSPVSFDISRAIWFGFTATKYFRRDFRWIWTTWSPFGNFFTIEWAHTAHFDWAISGLVQSLEYLRQAWLLSKLPVNFRQRRSSWTSPQFISSVSAGGSLELLRSNGVRSPFRSSIWQKPSKSIAPKIFAKLRRAHDFSQIIPAVRAIWRAFPVTVFGTAGDGEAQRINWPDFGEANKCGNGHEPLFPVFVQDNCHWTGNASGEWHRCWPNPTENLNFPDAKTFAVDISLWSKTVPLRHPRPWRKNGEKFKIQFTDLSQCIVRIQIHQDGALPAFVLLAGLYQMLAWTADVPSKCRIPWDPHMQSNGCF